MSFEQISKDISMDLGNFLTIRPYIGIINALGKVCYMDSELEGYLEYIEKFMTTTFPVLRVGDHSVPISGIQMIFFKISEKAMVILLIKKGALGQLLAFKPLMSKYAPKIDSSVGDIKVTITREIEKVTVKEKVTVEISQGTKAEETEEKGKIKYLPVLVKDLGETKIPIDHARILNWCDGKHDVNGIIKETKTTRLFVDQIIREYQKKGFIKLKRVI